MNLGLSLIQNCPKKVFSFLKLFLKANIWVTLLGKIKLGQHCFVVVKGFKVTIHHAITRQPPIIPRVLMGWHQMLSLDNLPSSIEGFNGVAPQMLHS
jgi:hypothetical protein